VCGANEKHFAQMRDSVQMQGEGGPRWRKSSQWIPGHFGPFDLGSDDTRVT